MTGPDNKELRISLEKHYDKALEDQKELMLSKFENIREAITKADAYTSYRDQKQNEFRGALDDVNQRLADQAKHFATKSDIENMDKQFNIWMSGMKQLQEANFNVAVDKVIKVEKELASLMNRKVGSATVLPWVISAILFIISMVTGILSFYQK